MIIEAVKCKFPPFFNAQLGPENSLELFTVIGQAEQTS